MKAQQVEDLKARRADLAERLQAMLNMPIEERPTQKMKLREWLQEMETSTKLLAEVDALLAKLEPKPPARKRATRAAPAVDGPPDTILARIPKGYGAELRVSAGEWMGRRTIDIRTWARLKGEGEFVATKKGVQVDAGKLEALIAALRLAQQHA